MWRTLRLSPRNFGGGSRSKAMVGMDLRVSFVMRKTIHKKSVTCFC